MRRCDDLGREQPDGGLRRREPSSPLPPSDTARPIDYLDVRITAEHVLASAAIPALLPAVDVSTPDAARGWYADGGIRLNAPLKPVLSPGWPKRGLQSRKLLCPSCYRIEPSRAEEAGDDRSARNGHRAADPHLHRTVVPLLRR
ncbi:patatin-like phospholipase family protein [Rhodococcus opacus]|nr:patatin-like phospholipase family protein [Rhodococcus opacus]